ncbi:receptor-like protein 49 [Rutidosis leptorrhynchoides]|uniref:receptor-like protein 49 n=1 Tax=Rutidosis leptorrhynchoides TaxID=125765 RepID=UPI003A99FF56
MSNSKLVYSVLVFFCCFTCSTVSSYFFNTSLTTEHIFKCPAQQSRALLLFKDDLFEDIFSDLATDYSSCKNWLGDEGYHPITMNWNTNTDCCDWKGVTCDHSTGDVIGLDMSCGMVLGTILPNSTLFDLPRLQRLNLAFNNFEGSQIPNEIGRFSKSLTHLNVSKSLFSGKVPTNVTLLHNLVSIDLSSNDFSLEPHVFLSVLGNSTSLKELLLSDVIINSALPTFLNISSSSLKLLNLRGARLHGKLPGYFFNISSLEKLDLSGNQFTGQIPIEISHLPKLVSLDLSSNHYLRIKPNVFNNLLNSSTLMRDLRLHDVNISWVLPTEHINISSYLNYLDLGNCSLMGSLPKSPLNITHLTYLDLSNNKLNGALSSWLLVLPSLVYLDLSNNIFNGDVFFNSSALPALQNLNLGKNQLVGRIDQAIILKLSNLTLLDLSNNNFGSDWGLDTLLSSLTNLYYLDLSYNHFSLTTNNAIHYANHNIRFLYLASCKLKEFPMSLRYMISLFRLDLSSNEIKGDIPIWAREIGDNYYLNMSDNFFPNRLNFLNLSHNFITGLPQFQHYGLQYLFLQSNQIQGPFPPSICNMTNLHSLDLSENGFSGRIPQCWVNNTYVFAMDLSNNDFNGTIPNMFGDCGYLEGLILKGNRFQGELPSSLSKCQALKVLDLGNNLLNGRLPHWLGHLQNLQALILKSNNFYGPIRTSPIVESPFASLRVLDLSHNGFVGQLPRKYFENLKAMMSGLMSTNLEYLQINGEYYSVVISVKGQDLVFAKISVDYKILDLSSNRFEGEIPNIIGNLTSLIVLNLSHNNLTGRIPHDFGKLKSIESLDLSCNRLTGEIPQSLSELTFLGFLNLSQNQLEGRIPSSTQFNTFEGSFGGNPKLCGLPLPKKCNKNLDESHTEGEEVRDEEENGFTWKVVILGYGCGTLFGFVIGYLMLSTGRPKWYTSITDAGERMILTHQKKRRRIIYIGS